MKRTDPSALNKRREEKTKYEEKNTYKRKISNQKQKNRIIWNEFQLSWGESGGEKKKKTESRKN